METTFEYAGVKFPITHEYGVMAVNLATGLARNAGVDTSDEKAMQAAILRQIRMMLGIVADTASAQMEAKLPEINRAAQAHPEYIAHFGAFQDALRVLKSRYNGVEFSFETEDEITAAFSRQQFVTNAEMLALENGTLESYVDEQEDGTTVRGWTLTIAAPTEFKLRRDVLVGWMHARAKSSGIPEAQIHIVPTDGGYEIALAKAPKAAASSNSSNGRAYKFVVRMSPHDGTECTGTSRECAEWLIHKGISRAVLEAPGGFASNFRTGKANGFLAWRKYEDGTCAPIAHEIAFPNN